MIHNNSPWLHSIVRSESFPRIDKNTETDIVIVGGGISGVLTAFALLEETNKNIILVDAHRIAHGATGHNAGNLTSMLEVSLPSLIKKHGEEKVKKSLQKMEESWDILEHIIRTTGISGEYSQFIGYGGYANQETLKTELENLFYYQKWGLWSGKVLVSLDQDISTFPDHLQNLCSFVALEEINTLLDTQSDSGFFAAIPEKMGIANSALFSESLLLWCLEHYPERLKVAEHSPVNHVHAVQNSVILSVDEYKIHANEVILCTNGFEHITLTTEDFDIDTSFHHNVRGIVGYMASYIQDKIYEPSAAWFYEKDSMMTNNPETDDPYFYLTKRPLYIQEKAKGMMVVGGPEIPLEDRMEYERKTHIDDSIIQEMDTFVSHTFKESPLLDRTFVWHGLMGYTKTGLRIVGREPCAKNILYNLGCNGVGIIPAFWSCKRIADFINNTVSYETIFDPENISCIMNKQRPL